MRPLKPETQDADILRDLGSASVQIVHDIKNQLNGLKLYATFLRKRLEKADRPADELETLSKLIAGLERAASDMTALVRYGRDLELRRQAGTDLSRLLAEAAGDAALSNEAGACEGDFDPMLLSEALKSITTGGRSDGREGVAAGWEGIVLRREPGGAGAFAVIEWRSRGTGGQAGADPFRSFAGGTGLRLALAARIIRAHGGEVSHEAGITRARLPLRNAER